MIQQIILVFDDPSCLPHLCTPMAHLLALTNVQRSHISLRGVEKKKETSKIIYCHQASLCRNLSYFTPVFFPLRALTERKLDMFNISQSKTNNHEAVLDSINLALVDCKDYCRTE